MRTDRIAIVFAYIDDGEFLEGGKIHALVESSFFGGTVTEKIHDDVFLLLILHAEGVARGIRNAGADDSGLAHDTRLHVDKVHRTTFAMGAAGRLAPKLGKHLLEVPSLGDVERVTTIGAEDDVLAL